MKKKNLILNLLLVIFLVVAGISGYLIYSYYHESRKNEELVSSLKEMITEEPVQKSVQENSEDTGTESKNEEKDTVVADEQTAISKKFQQLYDKNHDFVGWISIAETPVDYPVMQCIEDEQRYMRKNFDRDYALAGTPFLSALSDASIPSFNMLIYGHNMQDDTMFGTLSKYLDQDYWQTHKEVKFDTIYGFHAYEVVAAFHFDTQYSGDKDYSVYTVQNVNSEEIKKQFVDMINQKNELPGTINLSQEDHFLTLSTCDDTGANKGKRFIVVAKEMKEKNSK